LYNSEIISLWGCNFWIGGLVYNIKIILTKDQEKSDEDKERVRIRKSRCIKLDGTYCCIGKFNVALSLYKVLEITFYFSKSFLETAAKAS